MESSRWSRRRAFRHSARVDLGLGLLGTSNVDGTADDGGPASYGASGPAAVTAGCHFIGRACEARRGRSLWRSREDVDAGAERSLSLRGCCPRLWLRSGTRSRSCSWPSCSSGGCSYERRCGSSRLRAPSPDRTPRWQSCSRLLRSRRGKRCVWRRPRQTRHRRHGILTGGKHHRKRRTHTGDLSQLHGRALLGPPRGHDGLSGGGLQVFAHKCDKGAAEGTGGATSCVLANVDDGGQKDVRQLGTVTGTRMGGRKCRDQGVRRPGFVCLSPHLAGFIIAFVTLFSCFGTADSQKNVFPLPSLGSQNFDTELGVSSPLDGIGCAGSQVAWAEEGISALNELRGTRTAHAGISTSEVQRASLKRIAAAYRRIGADKKLPPVRPLPEPPPRVGALRELLGSSSAYSGNRSDVMPYTEENISWPNTEAEPVPLRPLLLAADREWL